MSQDWKHQKRNTDKEKKRWVLRLLIIYRSESWSGTGKDDRGVSSEGEDTGERWYPESQVKDKVKKEGVFVHDKRCK